MTQFCYLFRSTLFYDVSQPTPKDYYVKFLTPQFRQKLELLLIIFFLLSHSIPTFSGRPVLIVRVFGVHSTPTFSVILDSKHGEATLLGDLCACSNDFRHVSPIDVTPEAF